MRFAITGCGLIGQKRLKTIPRPRPARPLLVNVTRRYIGESSKYFSCRTEFLRTTGEADCYNIEAHASPNLETLINSFTINSFSM